MSSMTVAAPPNLGPRAGSRRLQGLTGYAFVAPWVFALVFFIGYPFFSSFYFSLCDYPPLKGPQYIGLDNYRELASDAVFQRSMGVTLIYAAVSIPLGVVLAMALAMLLNARIRGQTFYRVVYYLPYLIPGVVSALLWQWIFNPDFGLLNIVLKKTMAGLDAWAGLFFHLQFATHPTTKVVSSSVYPHSAALLLLIFPLVALGWWWGGRRGTERPRALGAAIQLGVVTSAIPALYAALVWLDPADMLQWHSPAWLSDANPMPASVPFAPSWALWGLIVMGVWGVGQMAVIYLAKLQDVPYDLYEAADIDGATWWGKTRHVTIPMISPVILFNVVMAIIGTFQVFEGPYIMTNGGPQDKTRLIAMFVYEQAFLYMRVGYASAVAWVLFLIIVALTVLAFRLSQRHVFYQGR